MSEASLTSVVLFLGVCILISLGVGYLLIEQMRLLERFSWREGMSNETAPGLYFFYSESCPFTPEARKLWAELPEHPLLPKREVNCSDPKNEALCLREGIKTVPAFKVISPRMTKRIDDWPNREEIMRAISEATAAVPVRVML